MADTAITLLYVTAPDRETARQLARRVIEKEAAACANVLPGMRSVYRWQGRVVEADEAVLIVKTTRDHADAATRILVDAHPYDEPCVIALPVDGSTGAQPFLDWIRAETA